MKEQFTQGKWVLEEGAVIAEDSRQVICSKIDGITIRELLANAYLIAAAPLMYRELEKIKAALEITICAAQHSGILEEFKRIYRVVGDVLPGNGVIDIEDVLKRANGMRQQSLVNRASNRVGMHYWGSIDGGDFVWCAGHVPTGLFKNNLHKQGIPDAEFGDILYCWAVYDDDVCESIRITSPKEPGAFPITYYGS